MGQRAVASDGRQNDADDDELDDLERGQAQLRREAAQRSKRIQTRRQQQLKKDAAKRLAKRNRMFKVAGVWIGVLVVGFLAVAWFSPALVTWMHNTMR